jgi:signal transduction histidine kinase
LLALFGDTVFFLIVASYGAEGMLWLASAFYLFLLGEGLAFYSTVEVVVIVAVCAVFCAVLPYGAPALERTVVVAGVVACAFAVNKRERDREIEQLREKAIESEKAAEKAREVERVRIASDFHDGPLQSFISLQMRLEILRKLMDRDLNAGMADLKQLQALAQTQVRDLRTFLHSMRPVDVDGANLVATARRAAESFQKESGIPVTFLGTNSQCCKWCARRCTTCRSTRGRRGWRWPWRRRTGAWRFRWTITATGSDSRGRTRWRNWNCCAWDRQV